MADDRLALMAHLLRPPRPRPPRPPPPGGHQASLRRLSARSGPLRGMRDGQRPRGGGTAKGRGA